MVDALKAEDDGKRKGIYMYVCIDGWMYIALPEAFKWMGDARYRFMFL